MAFFQTFKPIKGHKKTVRPVKVINNGVFKLLSPSTLARAVLGPLWMFLSLTEHIAQLPVSTGCAHLQVTVSNRPLCTSIPESARRSQKSEILAANFAHIMLAMYDYPMYF